MAEETPKKKRGRPPKQKIEEAPLPQPAEPKRWKKDPTKIRRLTDEEVKAMRAEILRYTGNKDSKRSVQRKQLILELISKGQTIAEAIKTVGIWRSTYYEYRKWDKEWALAVDKMRAEKRIQKTLRRLDPKKKLTFEEFRLQVLGRHTFPHMKQWLEWMTSSEHDHILILACPETSKHLALDTPVPTPQGWTTVGDIKVGDWIFSDQGIPTRVVSKSEVVLRKTYRITFADGTSVIATDRHLWTVRERNASPKYSLKVKTTEEMSQNFLIGGRPNYSIPVPRPLQLPERDLPIDPYVLGVWLGDGHARDGRITNNDSEVWANIQKAGYRLGKLHRDRRTGAITRTVLGIKVALRELGLLENKHVPILYLRASEQQRWALLTGLMDSDGGCSKKGYCYFSSTNARLVRGAEELMRSLGLKVRRAENRAMLKGKDCGPTWKLYFKSEKPVFTIPRKRDRQHIQAPQGPRREWECIKDITEIDPVPCQCLAVDAPSHLFIAGESFKVTHNTTFVLDFILYSIYLNSDIRIGYVSKSQPHAIKQVARVKNIIQDNKILQGLTGRLVPMEGDPHPWRESYFTVRTRRWVPGEDESDYTLAAFGAGSQITGSRFDLIIFDDPDDVNLGASEREKIWNVLLQAGEPLALDTLVPTPSGWTTIGEILPGDQVFSSDGRVANVVAVHPVHYHRKTYRVTFTDGTSVVCDGGHLWRVRDRRLGGAPLVTRTTEEMMRLDVRRSYPTHSRFFVPLPPPLEMKPAELPIDPYTLGAWLGDGDSKSGMICGLPKDLKWITKRIKAAGFRISFRKRDPKRSAIGIGILGLQRLLRIEGLLRNKHIPPAYLRGSLDQRLELLRGLMDTDGSADNHSKCEFSSKDRNLALQVMELLRSCGYSPTLMRRIDPRSRTGEHWRIYFRGHPDRNPFSLPRKKNRIRGTPKIRYRGILKIEPVPSVPVRCITVDTEDHLFLVGDGFVPTHNTRLGTSGKMIVIGNRQAEDDVYGRILQQASDDPDLWAIHTQKAIISEDPPEVIWPEKFGLAKGEVTQSIKPGGKWSMKRAYEFFDKKRRRLGYRFDLIYQNEPRSEVLRDFTADMIAKAEDNVRKVGVIPPGSIIICSMDPAPVGGACILVYALMPPEEGQEPKRLVVDLEWGTNWRYDGTLERVERFSTRYRPHIWVIERSPLSRYLLDSPDLQKTIQRTCGAYIYDPTTGRNKTNVDMGVSSLRALFDPPTLIIPSGDAESHERMRPLVQQLLDYYPETSSPTDAVMALWFAERTVREMNLVRRFRARAGQNKTRYWSSPYGVDWKGGSWTFAKVV